MYQFKKLLLRGVLLVSLFSAPAVMAEVSGTPNLPPESPMTAVTPPQEDNDLSPGGLSLGVVYYGRPYFYRPYRYYYPYRPYYYNYYYYPYRPYYYNYRW